MKALIALAAIALSSLPHMANAAPITVDVTLGPGGTYTLSAPGAITVTPNISLTNLNTQFSKVQGASLSGGVLTVGNGSPNSLFGYANYVINNPTGAVNNPNIFGFTWLNPSASQFVQVATSAASGGLGSYSITGGAFSPFITGSDPLNVVIIDPFAVLAGAEFQSVFGNGTTSGFQVSNFGVASSLSQVPLPASAYMFLTALGGLFLFRRKLLNNI